MTIKVTLQVPEAVYRLAQKTAKATSRPVEKVLADVVLAASPVSDDLSPELRKELETLARLRTSALWTLARQTFPADRRREYDWLLKKNSEGLLTKKERERLKKVRFKSERLMLRKAQAYALLKWRGHVLPALTEIPLPR